MEEEAKISALEENNRLLLQMVTNSRDWKIPLRNGLLAGVGTVVGAAATVWVTLTVLTPFKNIEALKPTLERLTQALERDQRK